MSQNSEVFNMTFKEAKEEYNKTIKDARELLNERVNDYLKELGLDGLVVRKKDGKVGVIRFGVSTLWDFDFFPITKAGKESKKASGFIWILEEEFEPLRE